MSVCPRGGGGEVSLSPYPGQEQGTGLGPVQVPLSSVCGTSTGPHPARQANGPQEALILHIIHMIQSIFRTEGQESYPEI